LREHIKRRLFVAWKSEPTALPIHNLVLRYFAANVVQSAFWRVECSDAASPWWIFVQHLGASERAQGWKIHISAGVAFIEKVLERSLPILLAENASFKVIASIERLDDLNQGRAGITQIGKCITVYPNDDRQAIRLAVAFDMATSGLRGPAVLSDRPLRPGSLVHYRYGCFSREQVVVQAGASIPAIRQPDGTLVPDRKAVGNHTPDWAIDPFRAAGVAVLLPEDEPLLNGRYLVTEILHLSSRGTVARGVDIVASRRCVLKRAARDAMMQPDGRDARDYLRNAAAILNRLAPDPRFPEVLDLFEHEKDLILVMEDMGSSTLAKYVSSIIDQGRRVTEQQIYTWIREIAVLLGYLHNQGLIYRDLKATNIVVTSQGQLCLIDFDSICDLNNPAMFTWLGTPGYVSPQHTAGEPPSPSDDIYGLGVLCLFLTNAVGSSTLPNPVALLDHVHDHINHITYPWLATFIARCLAPKPSERFPSMQAVEATLVALGNSLATSDFIKMAKELNIQQSSIDPNDTFRPANGSPSPL
jgi:hypothetical protein